MALTAGGVAVYYDSAGHLFENPSDAQIASLSLQIAGKADASAIPQPATTTPKSEMTGGAVGALPTRYAREDHQHPRLTSTTVGSVTAGNTATIDFTRAFTNEPGIDYSELPPAADTATPAAADTAANQQPTMHKVISWKFGPSAAMPNAPAGSYTGCTIRVWKAQTVPTNLATLLLGGVFNLFAASVVGTRFSLIAIARSDVPAT